MLLIAEKLKNDTSSPLPQSLGTEVMVFPARLGRGSAVQAASWRVTHFKSELSVFEVCGLCKRNLIMCAVNSSYSNRTHVHTIAHPRRH